MERLEVKTESDCYSILIGEKLFSASTTRTELERHLRDRTCLLITDDTVGSLYGTRLLRIIREAGARDCNVVSFSPGEPSKTLDSIARICREAVRVGLDRNSRIVALGGGVVGDMAGFAAAVYMRGIPFIQVPTTLLAMVDSSVGGKTAVDLPEGKNLIGAFHQPLLVLAELSWLQTLPPRQIRCGAAEIIKYGMILDPVFFEFLEESAKALTALDVPVCHRVVRESCRMKAKVVAEDEKESRGIREILNFGHTFGHALEALGGYSSLTHGEAVAVGMVMASDLSERLELAPTGTAERLKNLLDAVGLPCRTPLAGGTPGTVIEAMFRDKKVRNGILRLVLVRDIGTAEVIELDDHGLLGEVIGRHCGKP